MSTRNEGVGSGATEAILAALGVDPGPPEPPQEVAGSPTRGLRWDEPPIPLSARRMLPAFPLDVFPAWAGEMAEAVTAFLQTPPDLAGCLLLAVLSTAAGGRTSVEVRPGWVEPVNLFVVVAMPPGERKSPAFKAMTAPILAAERALVEECAPRVEEAELAVRVAKARAERAAKAAEAASTAQAEHEATAEALDAAGDVRRLVVPVLPQLVADDVTAEAAASLLATQGGRLAVLSDEGGIFATLAGRYSGTPNLEVFLKGHAGTMLRVNRTGRASEHVEAPALTLGLAVQPEVLEDIAGMPGFRGRGLLARILFSLPTSTVGRRTPGTPAPAVPVATAYAGAVHELVVALHALDESALLRLDGDAAAAVVQFEAELEPLLGPGGALSSITDWAGKLTGAVARIAGLLHLARHGTGGLGWPVSAATWHDATRLGRYFLAHALATFELMGSDPLVDDARHLLAWITRRRVEEFSRREIFDGVRNQRIAKVGDIDAPLRLLAEHGWIQLLDPPPAGPRGGRPQAPRFAVHPAALDDAPARAREPRGPAQPAQPAEPLTDRRSAGFAGSA